MARSRNDRRIKGRSLRRRLCASFTVAGAHRYRGGFGGQIRGFNTGAGAQSVSVVEVLD